MDADALLAVLRDDAEGGPLDAFCAVLLEHLLGRRLVDLIDPERHAAMAAKALRRWQQSGRGAERLRVGWDAALTRLAADGRPLGEVLPAPVREAVEGLAGSEATLDPELLLRTLDRPPVRALIREVLHDTLLEFGRKVAAPVGAPKLGALGGFGRSAADRLMARAGTLGAVAEEALGAVGAELERQLDRKASEVASAALSSVLARLVAAMTAPDRAGDAAALRVALVQGAWEWTGAEAAAELRRVDADAVQAIARDALDAWLDDDLEADLVAALRKALDEAGGRTAADALQSLDLLDTLRSEGRALLREHAAAFVASPELAAWLRATMA